MLCNYQFSKRDRNMSGSIVPVNMRCLPSLSIPCGGLGVSVGKLAVGKWKRSVYPLKSSICFTEKENIWKYFAWMSLVTSDAHTYNQDENGWRCAQSRRGAHG